MAITNPEVNLIPFSQTSFSGGINTSSPATEIADDEVLDQQNLELDFGDNLVTRAGVAATTPTHTTRITSIFYFQNQSGFVGILYTTGTTLRSRNLGGVVTDITGGNTFPDDTFWQWKEMNGIAIGVNKATSGTNPVKVSGAAPGTAAALGGSPPKAKYIEIWNSRVWLVRADFPNQVQCSDVGNPEAWNTDGGLNPAHGAIFDIETDDGDVITGIHATKDRLFVFKRRSIYYFEMTATPVTDLNNIRRVLYSRQIGCVAPYTIKTVANDVLFLSEAGVASLSAVNTVANFEESLISRKVKDISRIGKNTEEISAMVLDDMTQYWLSVPAIASPTGNNITYVLDFRKALEGTVRWTIFNGYAWGTSFDRQPGLSNLRYLIGVQDGPTTHFLGLYNPNVTPRLYADGIKSYRKFFKTKFYDFDLANLRKEYFEWTMVLSVLTQNLGFSVNYFFNEEIQTAGGYSLNFVITTVGSKYDVSLYDQALYDLSDAAVRQIIRKAFQYGPKGRKSLNVSFEVVNDQINQAFVLEKFSMLYLPLTSDLTQTA